MIDRVSIKVPKLEQSMRRLRKIAPALDVELGEANDKSGAELTALQKRLAPKGASGDLSKSIRHERAHGVEGASRSAVAVFAIWRWIYTEFGTVHSLAQPFMYPAWRLLQKRIIARGRRAISKAIKKALS